MELMMNEQGGFALFDDTYDVVIHCDSKKARDEVIADLQAINDRLDVLDKIREELIQSIQNGTLKIESGNEELFRIIDKYRGESEGK